MNQPLIKINLKSFNYQESHPVLTDISLEIFRREIVGFVGPNGAGKTTLLKILSGLLHVHGGGPHIDGYGDVSSLKTSSLARIISWMPSEIKAIYDYSVFETVLMGRLPYVRFFSSPTKNDMSKTSKALSLVGLSAFSHRKISALSSGERQLVYLAQAIAQETPIMIMDEPTAHLDIKHSLKIFSILRALTDEEGKTVIFSHHDLNTAAFFSTRIVMIKNGSIMAEGSPSQIITEENVNRLYSISCEEDEISYKVAPTNNVNGIAPFIYPSRKNIK